MSSYGDFLGSKAKAEVGCGFKPLSMPDFLFDFQAMLTDWMIRNGRSAVFADCLAGESVIHSPDGDTAIEEAYHRRKPIRVFALEKGKVVIADASAPFIAGRAELHRYVLGSGKTIIATKRHRFLTPSGWAFGDSLQIGERLAVSDANHLRSISESYPSAHAEGDPRWTQTIQDCQYDCLTCPHRCDEQPPLDEGNAQCGLPSLTDVHEHNRQLLQTDVMDNESGCNHQRQFVCLPSIVHCDDLVESVGEAEEYQLLSSAASCNHESSHISLQVAGDTNPSLQVSEHHLSGELLSEDVLYEPCQTPLVKWDTLVAIYYIRTDVYYDIEVPGPACFLANNIWSHNCGLGKTPMSLVWGDNVVRKTNKPVMIFTPLAVAQQYVREGEKFGIPVHHARNGKIRKGINVVNYERIHYFDRNDFGGVGCDESGRVKHHDTKTRRAVTDFVRDTPYRLLGTATPAPNDFMELGNSAEILGAMKYAQVLSMFFTHDGKNTQQWRLRGHAKRKFWQWVSGWARAVRKPSDLGFDDGKFELPALRLKQYTVKSQRPAYGFLVEEARTLNEQRLERKLTLQSRCEKVAEIVPKDRPFLVWCHLNPEGDLLEKLIPGAVQVAGRHSVDEKEERLNAFSQGQIRVLITKPKIGGWGLNWQHCSDMSFFPSHSWEQWYQAVRRCWRFGQERPVTVNIVTSEAEASVLANMKRKEKQAEEMYNGIIRGMAEFQAGRRPIIEKKAMEVPSWV